MDKALMRQLQTRFDAMIRTLPDEGVEFWLARDLMDPLGYMRWENFQTVVKRAIISCETTGYDPDNHFRGVTKMVRLNSNPANYLKPRKCNQWPITTTPA
ncbi:MAG: hypothetical protein LBC94_06400 [Desulfovibrio sp.]|jgi:DNA-damage-inducible protein D|nr:hypothetical protein [Desulfovibrio sp.]